MNPSPKCPECPFYLKNCKQFVPVGPEFSKQPNPLFTIIGESPGYEEKWRGKPFVGPTGRAMWARFKEFGVAREDFHLVNRIACCPPKNKKTDKNMQKAAACCQPYFQANLQKCKSTPRLYLGKYAWVGELTAKEAPLAKGLIYKNSMSLEHPTYVFFHKTVMQIPWLAGVERFVKYARRQHSVVQWRIPKLGMSDVILQHLSDLGDYVAWDVETYGIDHHDPEFKITCIGFSDGKVALSIPWDTYSTQTQGLVWGLEYYGTLGQKLRAGVIALFKSSRTLITHNGNYDCLAMRARGVEARNDFDTMLAYATVWPELPKNLEDTSVHLGNIPDRWKTTFNSTTKASKEKLKANQFVEVSPDILRTYNAHDAEATWRLAEVLRTVIARDSRIENLYANAMRNAGVVQQMRSAPGWVIDSARQQMLKGELTQRIEAATTEAQTLLADDFSTNEISVLNFNSSQQLQKIFYGLLEEPIKQRTLHGAPSMGKAALEHIARTGGEKSRKLAELLLKRKGATKLLEAFILNLEGKGWASPNINVVGQVSGRWSVTNPALQTTPAAMKPMFTSAPGNWLVLADYSQLELRINAQLAKDASLIEAYQKGLDVHRLNAASLFDLPLDQAGGHWRQSAKTFAYRLSYCTMDVEGAAAGIFETLSVGNRNLTYRAVLAAVERWWKQHPRLYERKQEILEQALASGYIEEPFLHRRRYFPGPKKPKETEIFNFPMQAGGAAIVDRAIQALNGELYHNTERLLLQRHDEIVGEGPDPVRLACILEDTMTQTIEIDGISMTYPVDLKIGLRWGCEVGISKGSGDKRYAVVCKCGAICPNSGDRHDAILVAMQHVGTCAKTKEAPEVLARAKAILKDYPARG